MLVRGSKRWNFLPHCIIKELGEPWQSRTFRVSFCHWSILIIASYSLSKHICALESGQPCYFHVGLRFQMFCWIWRPLHISNPHIPNFSLVIPGNQCFLSYCHLPRSWKGRDHWLWQQLSKLNLEKWKSYIKYGVTLHPLFQTFIEYFARCVGACKDKRQCLWS